jgi:DNA-binding CsgD family transcriptional regulator
MLNEVESMPIERAEAQATRTVACISVRVAGSGSCGPTNKPAVARFALRQVQNAVRSGDRVCPMGTSQLAVEFSPIANGIPPQVLGDRLAQAIGGQVVLDRSASELAVSVGMAAPEQHFGPSDLTRRALSAAQAGTSQLGRQASTGGHGSNTIVTVDRLLTPRSSGTRPGPLYQSIHRRSVYRYAAGQVEDSPSLVQTALIAAGELVPNVEPVPTDLTVLVADPTAAQTGSPGLASTTVASMADRLGCRTATVPVSVDDPLVVAVDGIPVDLVLLVLDGGWVGRTTSWASSAWGTPARLTAAYLAADIPVVVVSAGAGAGAIASCVAQGALAVFRLDHLPGALRGADPTSDHDPLPLTDVRLPPRFKALVGLTTSERRVLFYLTEGWAAQDIAEELVVSLTTVRSHIRSVLRKLGVRSQLAAVAIANSRDLEHNESGEAS